MADRDLHLENVRVAIQIGITTSDEARALIKAIETGDNNIIKELYEERQMKNIAEKIAFSFLGKPYLWGGDDPMAGFDCSGYCIEILKSVGILPRNGDWTAQTLWETFKEHQVSSPYNGCLVFWTNSSKSRVIHVEYAISEKLCIGASGGGSRTKDEDAAINQNAYIKVRPWGSRKYIKGFLDPYKTINR